MKPLVRVVISVLVLTLLSSSTWAMDVPVFGQRWDPWQWDQLGTCSDTIHESGCAITSIAMVFMYYGDVTDPRDMNYWLKANNGYSSGCYLKWEVPPGHSGGKVTYTGRNDWQSVAADLNVINGEIDAGYPVIAEVRLSGYQHFVVITSRDGGTYYINDPWYGDLSTINARYGTPTAAIYGIRKYHGSHTPPCAPADNIHWTSAPVGNRWYRSNEQLSYHVDGTGPVNVRETAPGHDATYQTTDGYLDLSYANPGWNEYRAHAWNNCGSSDVTWVGGWDPNVPSASKSGGADTGKWYNSPQTVNWSASDAQSGVKSQMYRWSGGNWVAGDGSTGAGIREGKNTLEVRVEDNAWNGGSQDGNVAVVNLGEYWRDTTGPVIQITGAAASTWLTGSDTVAWNVMDATSGVASVTVQWDGDTATPVEAAGATTLTEGQHTATFRAVDVAGNVSTVTAGPYQVDTTPPAVAASLSPSEPDGLHGWYVTAPTLTVDASDPNGSSASGIAGRFYTLDGQESAYTSSVAISGDGSKTVSARATDVAGNSSSTLTKTVKVDSTPPAISSVVVNSPSGSLTAAAVSWSGGDATSGISTYEYRIGTSDLGSEVREATEVGDLSYFVAEGLTLIAGRTYYITVRARDNAGLWSSPITRPFVALPANADQAPNFNNGGISDTTNARTSPNYRIVDSFGQFAVDTSTSANFVVESGYWHSEAVSTPRTMEDVRRALRIAGGLVRADGNDMARLDVAGGTSAGKIDLRDAETILRSLGPSSPATRLSFSVQPVGGQAGTALPTQPVVRVLDATGNVATAFNGPVNVAIKASTNTVGASLTGSGTANAVAGVASFVDVGVSKPGQGFVLTATSGTLTPADSQPFNVSLGGNITVPRAANTVLLDGSLGTAEWGTVPALALGSNAQDVLPGNWTGPADYQGTLQVQWDYDYLYLGLKVTDEKVSFSTLSTNDLWAWDGLELFLGLDNPQTSSRTSYGPGDYQIILSAIGNGSLAGAWYSPQSPGFISGTPSLVKAVRTAGGYTIEAAIPWLALDGQNNPPAAGQLIGFNAMGKDNDQTYGTEDSAFSLSGLDASSTNPSHWTTALLLP